MNKRVWVRFEMARMQTVYEVQKLWPDRWPVRPGFHYTTNTTTTTQKQSDYKVEQSSFTLIALF